MGDSTHAGPAGMAGPAVIADAYDLYADQLYAYCRFLVRDPADAVDALEDVFLVAAGRGAALPPDAQMRSWLFAVARNDCLRSISSRRTVPGPRPRPGEPADGYTDRALLGAAIWGLAPGDRDLVAMLWHGLDADDIATVFGSGRDEAFGLLDRALIQLESATSALLVARSGRHGCESLALLLRGWDGRLSVPLTRTLTQHIDRCRNCSARRQDELRPALLLSLTPAALLGAGVSAEALRPAAATVIALRDQVLSLACDPSAEGAEARARACVQAGPFDTQEQLDSLAPMGPGLPRVGFPVPLAADPAQRQSRKRLAVAATGAAAVAVAVTAVIIAGGGQARTSGSGMSGLDRNSASAVTITGASASPSASTASVAASSAAPTPSASPSPSATASPSSSPTMTPSRTAAASAAPPPSAKPTPTISVPSSVTLQWNHQQGEMEGTLPVTVNGGSAQWSISNPNSGLQLSVSSGTTSASVQISGRSHSPQPLTVTSGNISITVTLSVSFQGN